MTRRRRLRMMIRAHRHGARHVRVIEREARRAGIGFALGLALVEQESAFQPVFGHDPTIFCGAGRVTRRKYAAYRRARGSRGQGGMQGVSLTQLTWWQTQDRADAIGGCWRKRCNLRVGFETLASNIRERGRSKGIEAYNGAGPAAEAYSREVRAKARRWRNAIR